MSLSRNIDKLAEAIGKAMRLAQDINAADTATVAQLKSIVDDATARTQAVKEKAESLLIDLRVTGTDPGEGSALATRHGLLVVDGW